MDETPFDETAEEETPECALIKELVKALDGTIAMLALYDGPSGYRRLYNVRAAIAKAKAWEATMKRSIR